MKHRIKWGFGPAPGQASDRKGLARVGGLSGRTMRRQSTGNRGCVPTVPQTCRKRVGAVVYTTLPHAPFPAFAAWRADVRTRNRAAPGLGGFAALACAGCRLHGQLGRRGARVGLVRRGGHVCPTWPGTAQRGACVRQTCGFRAGVGASAWRTGPSFAVSSGMPFRKKSKLAKGRRWERMRPPDRGR